MDFADAMNQLTAHMEVTQWTPKGLVGFPDLTGFERQDTDMPLLPVEYVKQSGCADYGFHGTIFFPTPYPNGDGGFLHLQVEYHD